MKALLKALAVFLLLASLMVSGCSVARPLHRSEDHIRMSILKRTPPGTPKKDVEAFIAKEGWDPLDLQATERKNGIEVCFGGYFIFFGECYVYGIWTFDSADRLIEVHVSKSHDVL